LPPVDSSRRVGSFVSCPSERTDGEGLRGSFNDYYTQLSWEDRERCKNFDDAGEKDEGAYSLDQLPDPSVSLTDKLNTLIIPTNVNGERYDHPFDILSLGDQGYFYFNRGNYITAGTTSLPRVMDSSSFTGWLEEVVKVDSEVGRVNTEAESTVTVEGSETCSAMEQDGVSILESTCDGGGADFCHCYFEERKEVEEEENEDEEEEGDDEDDSILSIEQSGPLQFRILHVSGEYFPFPISFLSHNGVSTTRLFHVFSLPLSATLKWSPITVTNNTIFLRLRSSELPS